MILSRDAQEIIITKLESQFYEAVIDNCMMQSLNLHIKAIEAVLIKIRHVILNQNFEDDLLLRLLEIFGFCQNYLAEIKEKPSKYKLSA